MSVSKIKSLVIAALLLLNIFFLVFIISDKILDMGNERRDIENACAVLEANGIAVNPDDIHLRREIKTMRASRSLAAEEIIARAVLGPVVMTEQGGNIYQYDSTENGSAIFYSGGDFAVSVNEGAVKSSGGALKTVKRLLAEMRLETSEPLASGEQDNETITAVCSYKGAGIFNCVISFSFSGESLLTVLGKYVTGIEPNENTWEISSPGTAMLALLASVKRGEIECGAVEDFRAGYYLRDPGALGGGVIAPVWLVTADSGRYVIDAETGETRLLP